MAQTVRTDSEWQKNRALLILQNRSQVKNIGVNNVAIKSKPTLGPHSLR